MISIFIDPNFLSCPEVIEGHEAYEKFVSSLIECQELLKQEDCLLMLSKQTIEDLFTLNKYPLHDDLRVANLTFGINYIAPDSIMKIVNSIVRTSTFVEDMVDVKSMSYDEFLTDPNIYSISSNSQLVGSLTELLVNVTIKCRIKSEKSENHFFLTRSVPSENIGVSFTLRSLIYNAIRYDYPDFIPIRESESFDIFTSYDDLSAPTLIESEIKFNDKRIKLGGDHHGNRDLLDIAKKILRSPFVVAIVNSMPYNSYSRNFIYKVHENGLVDIILTRTDKGFSMRIQTTGRNKKETLMIAQKIETNLFRK